MFLLRTRSTEELVVREKAATLRTAKDDVEGAWMTYEKQSGSCCFGVVYFGGPGSEKKPVVMDEDQLMDTRSLRRFMRALKMYLRGSSLTLCSTNHVIQYITVRSTQWEDLNSMVLYVVPM